MVRDPRLRELAVSGIILLGSYLGARFLSYVMGRMLSRAARRTAAALDDRLIKALKRPVTYALFLVGAYAALHRLPGQDRWTDRLDDVLYALAVVVVGLALTRAYGILLAWYQTESPRGAGEVLTAEFGPLLSKLGKALIGLLAVIAVLQHFGVNVQSLVVSLGVGSLAVGLAAQDTLANMFAGFTLLLDRPFKIDDRIQLSTGETGDVEAIGIRSSRIRTLDETILVVPNSLLTKERLVNLTRPARQITTRIDVGVAYGSDLGKVKRILVDSALASARVDAERPPVALVTRFGDFGVQWRLVFWARDYLEQGLATSEVHEQIYLRLAEAGIEIPYPTPRLISPAAPREAPR